jgi:uncharacterized membrane protein
MDGQDKTSGLGVLAGLGIAAGTIAVGAIAARRASTPDGVDDAPGYTARRGFGKCEVSGRTVTIRKPRAELFAFWRDFANLVPVMENVERIEMKDRGRSVWTIKAPAGQTVDVETEIVSEKQDELIAWRSVEGSDIDTEGRVMFRDAPGERGTQVTLIVAYDPPAGKLGKTIAKLFLREPDIQARHDLKRFKMLMETGEITTSARRRENTRAAQQKEKENA